MSETPELSKDQIAREMTTRWSMNLHDRRVIQDFIEWLQEHPTLSKGSMSDIHPERHLDEYHEIDQAQLDRERLKRLDDLHLEREREAQECFDGFLATKNIRTGCLFVEGYLYPTKGGWEATCDTTGRVDGKLSFRHHNGRDDAWLSQTHEQSGAHVEKLADYLPYEVIPEPITKLPAYFPDSAVIRKIDGWNPYVIAANATDDWFANGFAQWGPVVDAKRFHTFADCLFWARYVEATSHHIAHWNDSMASNWIVPRRLDAAWSEFIKSVFLPFRDELSAGYSGCPIGLYEYIFYSGARTVLDHIFDKRKVVPSRAEAMRRELNKRMFVQWREDVSHDNWVQGEVERIMEKDD